MIFVPQITINETTLTSSTIANLSNGEVAWASGAFIVGQERVVLSVRKKFVCIKNCQSTLSPELDPDNWLDIGATNKYAMFDLHKNTQTISATPIVVEVTLPKRINTIVFAGMQATLIKVNMFVGANNVYSKEISLSVRNTKSWSDYFFGEFKRRKSTVFTGLPIFTGAKIKIEIFNANGIVKCGSVVINKAIYLGEMQYGAGASSINLSPIERDDLGTATLRPKPTYPSTKQKLIAKNALADVLLETKATYGGVPGAWVGIEEFPNSAIFNMYLIIGIFTMFDYAAVNAVEIEVNLELEEI